jgi:hypothetical protein
MVVLAQLVRVPDCGSGGRGFEPRIPPESRRLNSSAFLFPELFRLYIRHFTFCGLSQRLLNRKIPM